MLEKTERVFTIVLLSRDVTLRCVESMTMKVAGRGTYNRIARHKSRHSEKCCWMPLFDTGQFDEDRQGVGTSILKTERKDGERLPGVRDMARWPLDAITTIQFSSVADALIS